MRETNTKLRGKTLFESACPVN